ncbi:hypothetical protein VaNZ11_012664 [Volvox africanus]|uniref:Reverse transcriptase RNase H-like domain-containing protein n=1 Tax=Volvox africanus TaxID=51714 RepID=A0ABQ5SFS8_9CHLO|nr:hypothetical protein VaNZ11_012664 [Volvox africanus]
MLRDIGIKLHPEKTLITGDSVEFLGFMVSACGLSPTRAKVEALLALEPPTSSAGVRRLLGMFSYYRGLVPHFAHITAPLNPLTSTKYVWHAESWGPEQQAALDELKRIYTQMDGPVLRRVHPDRPLILHTDFSGVGMSGILGQLDDAGCEYLCAAVSRSLNVHERRYDSYKGELLAVVWATKLFYPYLAMRHIIVVTDHAPLLWLMSQQDGLPAQYTWWALQLQAFAFDVAHRPGKLHQNADALSRHPRDSAHDGSGARVDEDGDPLCSPPVLVPYPGVQWPLYAFSRAPSAAGAPAAVAAHLTVVAACSVALAQRFLDGQDLTDPASGLAAAPDAVGPLAGLAHFAGPVPRARAATWCVHAVCLVASTGLPVSAASELDYDNKLETLAAGQLAAGGLEAPGAGQPALGELETSVRGVLPSAGPHVPCSLSGPPVTGTFTTQTAALLISREAAALRRLRPSKVLPLRLRLAAGAWDSQLVPAFSIPADLLYWAASAAAAEALGFGDESVWIVVGSWAGNSMWSAAQIVGFLGGFRREWRLSPPAFLLEGPFVNVDTAPDAGWLFGLPVLLDAAVTGAAVHRLSCLYTNLANAVHLQHCVTELRPPDGRDLAALLPAGRVPAAACTVLAPPYVACDLPGRPCVALPPPAVTGTPLCTGPICAPCQVTAADYTVAAGFWLRTSRDLMLELDLELLERSSPPPVFQIALSLCMVLHHAFITPHDMQYPATKHLTALPQGGGSDLTPLAPVAALAAVGSVTRLAAGMTYNSVMVDADNLLTPWACALLSQRALAPCGDGHCCSSGGR